MLYFLVAPAIIGWIIFAVMTPVTICITWLWFRGRSLPHSYLMKAGVFWTMIAMIADYVFIVLLFSVQGYYRITVLAYYVVTFLIQIGIGLILTKKNEESISR